MTRRVSALWEIWHECNDRWFGGKLRPPTAIRITRAKKYDGTLLVTVSENDEIIRNKIMISAHVKDVLGVMLHEMIHQYQVFVLNEDPDHDGAFRCYAKYLERQTGATVR